ncbi:MAG: hypothetical protein FJ285_03825 [Planctomycetes bacterium]|nr:hypothetical protein [Planctomycetota bacterium]
MNITGVCNRSLVAGTFAAAFIAAGAAAQGSDECSGATALASDTPAAFNTTSATPSAGAVDDALCADTFLNWLPTQQDVWFKYTASESGLLEVNTCQSGSYDTSVVVYSGSCGSPTAIACNGDGAGLSGCQTYYSRITDIAMTAGQTVFIRIGGYDGEVGSGQVVAIFAATSSSCLGATGACNDAHLGLGCNDAACCQAVCNFNPLCCDVGWDQSCVTSAIEQCGYYFCPVVQGAPTNNCATSPITCPGSADSEFNFNTAAATMDGPDHPGAACQSGSEIIDHDIWYKIVPANNGSLKVSTCGSVTYDNKLAVYNLGTDPAAFDYNELAEALVGCNDDGTNCNTTGTPQTPYASELTVTVVAGRTYLIRLGSFATGETGTGTMRVTVPQACVLPSGGAEGENCGSDSNDGCNASGGFANINIGETIRGNFWADQDTRDTDFYQFQVTAPTQVTVDVKSSSLATVLLLKGDLTVPDCGGVQVLGTGSGTCPTSASSCLSPGLYYAFVAITGFTGAPCAAGLVNEYSIALSGTPATCPITLSGGFDGTATQPGVCAAPGPDSYSTSTAAAGGGLVACAAAPAFPNCSGGGTGANSFAKVIPAGQMSGEISCLDLGVFCVARDQNAAGTACATYISDIALPAKVGIYADLDGGTPRFKTADGGADGGDLELIEQVDVLVPGGAYVATLNYPQPVCVSDYATKNLVVIMDCPDMIVGQPGVPAASGYSLRAGGGTVAGQDSGTYVRLSCADAAAQYVLAESLGATFTAQWIVRANGTDVASCNAPACPGDFNNDGVRNGSDLTVMLSSWGTPSGDVNSDGTTNGQDLTILLSGWGACPTG